jgi:hypothetical protein
MTESFAFGLSKIAVHFPREWTATTIFINSESIKILRLNSKAFSFGNTGEISGKNRCTSEYHESAIAE